MNFNKIKSICEEKGLTIALLADKLELSEAGLYQSFRNQSMKVDVLEKIAEVLETPIWIFFDLDPDTQIESLKNEISGNKETIENLKTDIISLTKELVDFKAMFDLAHQIIETKTKLIANYEKLESNNAEILKAEKALPMVWETLNVLVGLVSGKIKKSSPEAQKALKFNPEDYPLPKLYK